MLGAVLSTILINPILRERNLGRTIGKQALDIALIRSEST